MVVATCTSYVIRSRSVAVSAMLDRSAKVKAEHGDIGY
jgi:hypothetical protein